MRRNSPSSNELCLQSCIYHNTDRVFNLDTRLTSTFALITKPIAYIFEILYAVQMCLCGWIARYALTIRRNWMEKKVRLVCQVTQGNFRYESTLISVYYTGSLVVSLRLLLCSSSVCCVWICLRLTPEIHLGSKGTTFASMHTRK